MKAKRSVLLQTLAIGVTAGLTFALGCGEDDEQDNGSNNNDDDESNMEAHFLSPRISAAWSYTCMIDGDGEVEC